MNGCECVPGSWNRSVLFLFAALQIAAGAASSEAGQVRFVHSDTNLFLQVKGDADDDWWIESSTDLSTWTRTNTPGAILSGGTNAPLMAIDPSLGERGFYRARKTGGLYDTTLLRTISLTFTQANWQTLLANGRTYSTNVFACLAMNNGATNYGIGARYRGNTSYTGMGGSGAPVKKSVAIAIDQTVTNADLMGYWNKGADYMFYYEPESGRFHPVEHDGNEAFVVGDASMSPVQGATDTSKPFLYRFLGNAELRQRYLAHMRTALQERFNPSFMIPLIDRFHQVSIAAIVADPKKGYTTMSTYTNDLKALKTFVTNRFNYLTNHAELKPLPPLIASVQGPAGRPAPSASPVITAQVLGDGTNGISSVWLYHRGHGYGRFAAVQMFDDGEHGDGPAGDAMFGASITNYPAGTKVRFYVEARSANAAKAACFSPPRAERETYSYRVGLTVSTNTPVVINELMAANTTTLTDPQRDYDDWIELHNITDAAVDLTGHYLSDEHNNPRKWKFPDGTTIPADGYLLVWADEDVSDTPGLHASFKLSGAGEHLFLADTDENLNAVLDSVTFPAQEDDISYGRSAADADTWATMVPTPGAPNK